jgi:hypothetical protein
MTGTLVEDDAETRAERRGDSTRDGTAPKRASKETNRGFGTTRDPVSFVNDQTSDGGVRPPRVTTEDEVPESSRRTSEPSEDISETSRLSNSRRRAEEPEDLTCPITKMMFRDPVFVAGSGNTYERDAIETFWRAKRDRRDPLTNASVKNANVFTNWTKRREVDAWLTRHPDQIPEGWCSRDVPRPLEERDARAARRRRARGRRTANAGGDETAGDDDEDDRFDGGHESLNSFLPRVFATLAATAMVATLFLASTTPAPPPGFPQFPPGVVPSAMKGSSSTGMPTPPAWYTAMKPLKPPSGSRISARRGCRGALEIVVPPFGVFTGNAAAELGFAATWATFTGAWTFGAFRGPTPVVSLFSVPFWGVSAHLSKAAIAAATETTRIVFFPPSDSEIKNSAGDVPFLANGKSPEGTFRVSWEVFGRAIGIAAGSLGDLDGAEIVTMAYVNGVPQTGVELREGVNSHALGKGLHRAEQKFIVQTVSEALAEAKKATEEAKRNAESETNEKTHAGAKRAHSTDERVRAPRSRL